MHPSADEQALFEAANRERSAQGLPLLEWDPILASAARQHAHVMARDNDLSHQCPGEPTLEQRAAQAGARFATIAENIAVGRDPDAIHDAWMHSPGHRENILNPEVTAVGIAAVKGSGGLFAVQDFSRPVAILSLEQQERKVMSLLTAAGLRAAHAAEDARKACSGNSEISGNQPLAIFRFRASDLSKLPDELRDKIRKRPYNKAAAGACATGEATGFVRYRIVVLLY